MTTSTMNGFIEHPATYSEAHGGDQWKFTFANGYGASVIKNSMSYGGGEGLWELGVLGPDRRLTYTTPIISDVEGYLSITDVAELLRRIAELPAVDGV